ncbi:MAG: hypothetical protein KatS3mg016_1452 [Fimbriimonadales bacterium]|nr:MAG: hypothetical protein KatS3mg016_1452 [Fimbriimonadales bacterium]
MIVPHNDRASAAYSRNLRLARQWRNALLLWGVESTIIVAGDVSKSQFQQQYDFGIVPTMENLTGSMAINSWLDYASGDKPLYLCGYHIPQGTAGTPVTGVVGLTPIENSTTNIKRVGRRALWQSGAMVYVASYAAQMNNVYYGLRVDTSNPQLQVLLRPDPDLHTADSHVFVARWYNRYFLPTTTDGFNRSLWVVPWILVNENAEPEWARPWTADIDHIISVSNSQMNFNYYLQTFQWLYTFCQQTGLVVHCGATTSALNNIRPTSPYLHRNGRTYNSQMQQIHQVLLAEQHRYFPVCLHDHFWTIEDTRGSGGVTTFTNPYGTFREMNSPAAFRAHWKGSMDEMQQMGFSDCHCSHYRYANFANNQFSDRYLRFLRDETPLRAVRIWSGSCVVSPHTRFMAPAPFTRNPLERRYGIEIVNSYDSLWVNADSSANLMNRLNIAVLDGYGSSSENVEILWARVMGHRFGNLMWERWLRDGALHYHHQVEMATEYPSPAMYVYEQMRNWRQILSGWIFLGSIKDAVTWRNRVRSTLG